MKGTRYSGISRFISEANSLKTLGGWVQGTEIATVPDNELRLLFSHLGYNFYGMKTRVKESKEYPSITSIFCVSDRTYVL